MYINIKINAYVLGWEADRNEIGNVVAWLVVGVWLELWLYWEVAGSDGVDYSGCGLVEARW